MRAVCANMPGQDSFNARREAAVTGKDSLNCGHCMAILPGRAITVGAIDDSMSQFESFELDRKWLPHGEFDTAQLVRLMASEGPAEVLLTNQCPRRSSMIS